MGQRIAGFLVVLLLMFSGEILGQNSLVPGTPAGMWSIHKKPSTYTSKFLLPDIIKYRDYTASANNFRLVNLPTASFYPNSLGIICRTELKMDKLTPLPLRFRLGSLEYVNWMERKPNALHTQIGQ